MSSRITLWMLLPATLAVVAGGVLKWTGRRLENNELLKLGLLADAEIIESHVFPGARGGRYTKVTYRFVPEGRSQAIEVTKCIQGALNIPVGTVIPVRYRAGYPHISILVPYADKLDAS